MTQPRQVIAGTVHLITRRCLLRKFLIRPSKEINQILLYCMTYASQKYKIEIHAFCFMSNHYHLLVTDPKEKLPKFLHWMNEFIAKCINVLYGRWGSLFEDGSYSAVMTANTHDIDKFDSREDILDKMVYILANPVAAGLVKHGYLWPGLWSSTSNTEKMRFTAKRPDVFFSPKSSLPEKVHLKLTHPFHFSNMSAEKFSELLTKKVQEREQIIQQKLKAQGRKFKGSKAVLNRSPYNQPARNEQRRKLNPRIACKNKKKRIELLESLKSFLVNHREAWEKFRKGVKDVVFPAGTYKMRVEFGVACESPP